MDLFEIDKLNIFMPFALNLRSDTTCNTPNLKDLGDYLFGI